MSVATASNQNKPDAALPAALLAEAQVRYSIGPAYTRAYLEYWRQERGSVANSLAEMMALPDPQPLWFDYALSTNWRARNLAQKFADQLPAPPGRYLDVGCGFGGCLVAFRELGYDVCGIELAPERVALSKANCRDVGLDGVVHQRSVLEPGIVATLGKFDVITCLDVIEHVLDVPQTLVNMIDLLNPHGVLILEIPNMDSAAFVASDGHFNLFGITQLDRERSIEYHRALFDFEYDVGYYHPLSYYVDFLARRGLHSTELPSPFHPPRVEDNAGEMVALVRRAQRDWLRDVAPKLTPAVRRAVVRRVRRYLASLVYNATRRRLGLLSERPYTLRFRTDFWTLIARKAAS